MIRPTLALLLLAAAACAQPEATPNPGSGQPEVALAAPHGPDPAAVPAGSTTPGAAIAPAEPVTAVVYKDAQCDCCAKWVDHMRAAGFTVVTHNVADLNEVKRKHGLQRSLQSCHTTEIGGYVVEGHVPADIVQRLLRERPDIAGIAVPGMPVGSPGMEWTYSEPYDVIAFTRSGATSVYDRR